MPYSARITIEHQPGCVLVTLIGEHDLATAPSVREHLDAALASGQSVVIDLSEAAFIDSSILGALYTTSTKAPKGQVVAVAAPPATMPRRLVDMVALSDEMPMFDSRAAALAYTGGGRADS